MSSKINDEIIFKIYVHHSNKEYDAACKLIHSYHAEEGSCFYKDYKELIFYLTQNHHLAQKKALSMLRHYLHG